jgi:NDP-sugar pyrophosphorylase family protein
LKALILAGGFGTRLRPLSCTRPKLLFPIANKPLLDLTLERLAANGIDEVVLAVSFMAEVLEKHCGDTKYGIRLHYSRDTPLMSRTLRSSQRALGTGGPVKQAQKLLGKKEPFLVLNGDILTDADYLGIMQGHEEKDGIATIALRRVEDPGRYGVVEMNEKKQIIKFTEKPSKEATNKLVNAGVYFFEPEIFNYIPTGKRCSLEREVFPKIAEERKLFGHEIKGLWIDVGEPADYILANQLWLKAGTGATIDARKVRVGKQSKIKEAVAMDEGVSVGEKSAIGPNVSLGKNTSIGKRVSVKDSIILPYTVILHDTTVEGAMIGESVTVGRGVKIGKGCLIGDGAIIKDGVRLARGTRVCPFREVSKDVLKPQSVI